MEKLTQPESIGRAYRKLIENGQITLPEEFKEARGQQEKNFRKFYSPKRRTQA
jgi:bifunctional DNA-binding transcriptional regulator/antitoxin component of YhaV-PrlF toxin-antitoxin module